MRRQDLIKTVWKNVWRNKVRTILTVAAVAIGCSSIILMMSLAIGLKAGAEEEIKQQGSLLEITVFGKLNQRQNMQPLKKEHVQVLKSIENVEAVLTTKRIQQSPKLKLGPYGTQHIEVLGVNVSEQKKVTNEMHSGEYFRNPKQGAVVSYAFINGLYKERDLQKMQEGTMTTEPKNQNINPLNRWVSLTFEKKTPEGAVLNKTIRVKIDGILKKPANRWMGSQSIIYLPEELLAEVIKWTGNPYGAPEYHIDPNMPREFLEMEQNRDYDQITISVNKVENVDQVLQDLEGQHFASYSITQNLEEMKLVFLIVQVVLGALGAIALVVASIGIVNTMIMSIMERTREIGIMKVVGANVPTVRKLFLMESGYIGLFGGLLGVFISLTLSSTANLVFRIIFSDVGNGPPITQISIVPFWLAAFGIVFSFFVGLLAGLYPANRAVSLSALEAIRQD